MGSENDHFKDIDFDKEWDEDDWERFFQAQDQLLRQRSAASHRRVADQDPALSFRHVLRRFGMDPDGSVSLSKVFNPDQSPEDVEFWKDGAAPDTLPVYAQTAAFLSRLDALCWRHFNKKLNKKYKSAQHRLRQELMGQVLFHAARIPSDSAAGHELGYEAAGVRGNIARCRRALASVESCLGALSRCPARLFPVGEHRRLFRETLRLRNNQTAWILYLRERFVRAG